MRKTRKPMENGCFVGPVPACCRKNTCIAAPDRVIIEETALNLLHEGTMTAIVDDPAAGNGRAVRLDSRDNGGWHTTLPMADVVFDKGVKYRLRIRSRISSVPRNRVQTGRIVYTCTERIVYTL